MLKRYGILFYMLDIQFIRENAKLVEEKSKQKGYEVNIKKLLDLDEKRRNLLSELENLRQKRNEHAASLNAGKPTDAQLSEGKELKSKIVGLEKQLEPIDQQQLAELKRVPNMPLESVPVGASEDENVIAKKVGDNPKFYF